MRWFTLLLVGCACVQAAGAVINVPADQATIQAGINASSPGDEVLVAPGVYNENIEIFSTGLILRSSGGASVTTIDGTGTGTSTILLFEVGGTHIEGFTITGGTGTLQNTSSGPKLTGGGILHFNGDWTLQDCIVIGNTAEIGAGVFHENNTGTIRGCLFLNNQGIDFAGAIYVGGGAVDASNCVFTGNTADIGGAMVIFGDDTRLINCTLTGNAAVTAGGAIAYFGNTGNVVNSILRNNTGGEIHDAAISPLTVTYSNVLGILSGAGNIDVPAGFVDADGTDNVFGTLDDNVHIVAGSLGIDAGDTNAVVAPSPLDLDGNDRVVNDPATTDTGLMILGLVVDQGVYEFQPPECLPDINTDGTVNVTDLLALLAAWGACP